MHLESVYALCPDVKFRLEEFGGIVYQREGDRLHFIKSPLAMELLSLAGKGTVGEIGAMLSGEKGAINTGAGSIKQILHRLEELGIIREIERVNETA